MGGGGWRENPGMLPEFRAGHVVLYTKPEDNAARERKTKDLASLREIKAAGLPLVPEVGPVTVE